MRKNVKVVEESLSIVENKPIVSEPVIEELKPFLFSVTELENFGGIFFDIVKRKMDAYYARTKIDVGRVGAKIWKMAVASKVAQKDPFILNQLINLETCPLCGKDTIWGAHCEWMDRTFKDGIKTDRMYYLNNVCPKCCEQSNCVYMYQPEWLDVVLSGAEDCQYTAMHNAKGYQCQLCCDHISESTLVYVPWGNKRLKVKVCDKHFDMIIGEVAKSTLSCLDKAKSLVESGSLSASFYNQMLAYQPIKNTRKLKVVKEKVVLANNVFDGVD